MAHLVRQSAVKYEERCLITCLAAQAFPSSFIFLWGSNYRSAPKNTKGDDAAPVASSPSVIVVALSVASLSFAMTGGAPVPPITA
jgi:hypothetical protein